MSFRSGGSAGPMTLSQVPGSPTFRSSAVNAVAVIPLLSSHRDGRDDPTTHSSKSFYDLLEALDRYNKQLAANVTQPGEDLLLVVPNSNLTRPGDWKYDNTPLKNFHWEHGCQRLSFFDGRPYNSRMAHDRLINHELTRNWIDLCPHRRTAALIGVLNVKDCSDDATLQRAKQEWEQWAERYSTPPYEVTAHGRDFERDFVVQKLFVFDSFDDSIKVDLNESNFGTSLVAFPPIDGERTHMMDVHMNVVINDLAVTIFQELEGKILESDAITKGTDGQPLAAATARSRFFQLSTKKEEEEGEKPRGSSDLSISSLASVVSPESKLASAAAASKKQQANKRTSISSKLSSASTKGSSSEAQLLTPLDDVWDYSELSPKDAQEMMRREVGRREKFAGDLSLLAGSPLDAYERYMKAAELCKTTCPDPLWYASALEGCAAAHIAMAEAGGFNVDDYLESSFQLPDEMMACAIIPSGEKTNKQTMTRVVGALCDDALNVLSRHPKLACFRSELLLKLAWYCGEVEDTHVRCQWGLGDGAYGGDVNAPKRRWEMSSAAQLNFLELKNKEGEDIVARNTLSRCQRWSDIMHRSVSSGALDPVTRADIALRCVSLCLKGLRPTEKPTSQLRSRTRVSFQRKAAFFAVVAAEAMSEIDGDTPDERTSALWLHASRMLTQAGNKQDTGSYGWAALRSVALHGLSMQSLRDSSEDAAVRLLSLMSEISPPKRRDDAGIFFSKYDAMEPDTPVGQDDSIRSDSLDTSYMGAESVVSAARSYVRERAKDARARGVSFFSGASTPSSLLAVAQSKWVEDDPIPSILVPMADYSDISYSIVSMKSVWSAIKYEQCADAQRKVVKQIIELRKNVPASSLPGGAPEHTSTLPLRIRSVVIAKSDSHAGLERVKVKKQTEEKTGAMATFFNPYANKKEQAKVTIVPEGEERYVLVKFANSLSVPLEIPRCQLEFSIQQRDAIKAPAISFVIPSQAENFAVQFPFIVLAGSTSGKKDDDESNIFEINGLFVTCLARSFFMRLSGSMASQSGNNMQIMRNIPERASRYPRRKYKKEASESGGGIKSPRLEIVPSQPHLLISFADSPTPIGEDTVIPAPLADGEDFILPKLCLKNDAGLVGLGKIEQLKVTAVGLPGHSEIVLFDLRGSGKPADTAAQSKKGEPRPLSLVAECKGINDTALNFGNSSSASISLKLAATTDFGAHCKGCSVTLRFRYRGKVPSPTLEVWRKREIHIRVLRIKGPRISSLTFRPDLMWDSSYSALCKAFAVQDKRGKYRVSTVTQSDSPLSRDNQNMAMQRLGQDPGVHVCGDKVVVIVSVANETASPIVLARERGNIGGFEGGPIDKVRVPSGVSAKIPMILSRINRAGNISAQVLSLTKLKWTSEVPQGGDATTNTGGTMVPVNRRVRQGSIEVPSGCLHSIVEENPIFLARICKAPCRINVSFATNGTSDCTVGVGKPLDFAAQVNLEDWIPEDVRRQLHVTLEFCCAPKYLSFVKDNSQHFVWCGHIRKYLPADTTDTNTSRGRIIFFDEGEYAISACVYFRRKDNNNDTKEVWWAEKALTVKVQELLPQSQ